MKDEISLLYEFAFHPSSFLLHPFHSGVWCNASIRVLGTRGDSSILSSPTKSNASLVQLVQDTALPTLRHRFESGTMLQTLLRSCSSNGRARRFERRGCRFKSCRESQFLI